MPFYILEIMRTKMLHSIITSVYGYKHIEYNHSNLRLKRLQKKKALANEQYQM